VILGKNGTTIEIRKGGGGGKLPKGIQSVLISEGNLQG